MESYIKRLQEIANPPPPPEADTVAQFFGAVPEQEFDKANKIPESMIPKKDFAGDMTKSMNSILTGTIQEQLASMQQTSPILRSIMEKTGYNRPLVGTVIPANTAEYIPEGAENEEYLVMGEGGIVTPMSQYKRDTHVMLIDEQAPNKPIQVFERTPEMNEGLASFGRLLGLGMAGDTEVAGGLKVAQSVRSAQTGNFGDAGTLSAGGVVDAGETVEDFATSNRISTRLPTAVKSTEDAINQDLSIGLNEIKSNPEVFDHNVGITKDYPNLRLDEINGTSDEISETYINHMKDNLLWLHDKVPENTRARSKLWYDGANKVANDWATEFNLPPSSVAGVLASLSPQKDWFMNASLGRRVLDVMANKQDEVFSDKMLEVAVNGYTKGSKKIDGIFSKPKFAEMLEYVKTKKLSELETSTEKAMWLRIYDEANNSSQYKTLSPEGNFTSNVLNNDGSPSSVAWSSLETIAKAIDAFESGGDVAKLTPLMGNKHKVRSFYNNIIDPNSAAGDVTIDTHAVAGATLRPVSGNSTIVHHNFGTSPEVKKRLPDWNGAVKSSKVNGVQGLYGMYAEAFRRAGAERGILPREMQSITWEAVRGLYTKGFKQSEQNVEKIDNLWYEYRKGNLSLDEVRNGIEQSTGGINPPSWE
tara:strand:- start:5729 stop:7663 length:1935 start_codon:yes stop_codon:yes gene_type:complete